MASQPPRRSSEAHSSRSPERYCQYNSTELVHNRLNIESYHLPACHCWESLVMVIQSRATIHVPPAPCVSVNLGLLANCCVPACQRMSL